MAIIALCITAIIEHKEITIVVNKRGASFNSYTMSKYHDNYYTF